MAPSGKAKGENTAARHHQRTLLFTDTQFESVVGGCIRTSVGPLVSAHVSKVDDMLAMQTLQEDGEAVRFDLADGHTQGPYPRWGNWQKGVCAHGSDSMPPMDCYPARAFVVSVEVKGAVDAEVCLAGMSCQMQTICLRLSVAYCA